MPKKASACRSEEPGIDPLNLQLVDNLLYDLNRNQPSFTNVTQGAAEWEMLTLPPNSLLISGLDVSCDANSSLAVRMSLSAPQLSK